MTIRRSRAARRAGASIGVVALALAAASTVHAKDTQRAWEGFATVTGATSQCAGVGGTGAGDTHVSVYRPKIRATDTPTFLSIMHLRAAITFENTSESTVPQMHGSGNYTAFGVNSRAKGMSFDGTYTAFTITPAAVTARTQIVTITGTINSFFNTPGCSVTFKGTYAPRID